MQASQKWFLGAIALPVVLSVFFIYGWSSTQHVDTQTEDTEQNNPSPAISTTELPATTAQPPKDTESDSMKTYSNDVFGFSMMYPARFGDPKETLFGTRTEIHFTGYNGLSLAAGVVYDQSKGRNLTISEIADGYLNASDFRNVQIEGTSIAGRPAVKVTYQAPGGKPSNYDVYIAIHPQSQEEYLLISGDYTVSSEGFNHLLNTVKFR